MKLFLLALVVLPACAGQVRAPIDSSSAEESSDDGPSNGLNDEDDGNSNSGTNDGDRDDTVDDDTRIWPTGDPGCGLTSAAFCDTFDAPVDAPQGRSYELDAKRWSLARNQPDRDRPNEIGRGSVSQCRSGVPTEVFPPGDTRICNGNDNLQSNHLLTVTAAQYYGSNAYRIRQPFDFANRTGTIVFDADATADMLLGFIAIAVTEDPIPSPSFSTHPGVGNFEGGVIPKNAVTVELYGLCADGSKVMQVNEYRDYVDYVHDAPNLGPLGSVCFTATHHRLNHFELQLSRTRLELWATPVSEDGVNFDNADLVASAELGLTFTRGYVQLITRNHATTKYWKSTNPADAYDAWIVRWDNVGFDGPLINNTREFEVPDALAPTADGRVAIGYVLGDASAATKTTVTIHGVDVAQADHARLAMNVQYIGNFPTDGLSAWALEYRLNDRTWRTYDLTAQEEALFGSGVAFQGDFAGETNALIIGVLGHVIDIEVGDLVDGDNVLEIATANVPFGEFPPTLANVDLILTDP